MGGWDATMLGPVVTITPYHLLSCGLFMAEVAPSSGTFVAANRAVYIPFRIPAPMVVTQLFSMNGAAVSGNIDVGIYDKDGTRLVSSGSTAQAGTSTIQAFNITDTLIGPGQFYLAVAMDNATGTLLRIFLFPANGTKVMGVAQQASAFALPATATFATESSGYFPMIGLTGRAVL